MRQYKELLVAVDFSEQSVKALETACDLGKQLDARLHIVHFVPMPTTSLDMEGMEVEAKYIEELHQNDMDQAAEKLENFIQSHTTADDNTAKHLCSGEPETEINSKAAEIHADMIVIGTHGRSGFKHLFMGSVAESVLKSADIPVLCVRTS